jgi:hypothetical protein
MRTRLAEQHFAEISSPVIGEDLAGDLFDLFNQISLLRYEDAENTGVLVLCHRDSQDEIDPLVRFTTPFDMSDIRSIRKLLQISEQRLRLLCTGRMVYGFVTGVDPPNTLTIHFQKHGMWEVRRAAAVLLQVSELATSTVEYSCFVESCNRLFGPMPMTGIQHLWDLVEAAKRQVRGTNVLITAQAAAEANRLGSQCIGVRPVLVTPSLMERFTAIDGTVILDTQGICYGVGAILDGSVSRRGDRSRGGRYNSALMYIDGSSFPSMIIVVSQNGTVDLVCNH